MQTLEVISLNIWQILISLCNLLILFLLFKKFLFKPVKKMLASRQAAIDAQYAEAATASGEAKAAKESYEARLSGAEAEAETILKTATDKANSRSDAIIEEARGRADGIVRQAEADAELERRKAQDDIRREIVDVSTQLSEKLLGREINEDDHRKMIDSFLDDMGEDR